MSIFAERLKALRLEHGEKQSDVAEILGVSIQSYSAYEGVREPKYDFLCKLSEHYNVTIDYLLGASNVKMKPEQVSATPEAGKLIGALTSEVVDFFDGMKEQYPTLSALFSDYILDCAKDAIERCQQCYEMRDFFTDDRGGIELGPIEFALWPKEYRPMTQEEKRVLYPRGKRIVAVDPEGNIEHLQA